jgi:hypothetical protein
VKKPVTLGDRETEALGYFFMIHWAALVLEPRKQQTLRSIMKDLDLVKPRGALALTPMGERVMKFCKDEGRPKYPHKHRRGTA